MFHFLSIACSTEETARAAGEKGKQLPSTELEGTTSLVDVAGIEAFDQ